MAIVREAGTENGMNELQCPVSDTVGRGRESRQDADGTSPWCSAGVSGFSAGPGVEKPAFGARRCTDQRQASVPSPVKQR